jgi:hypothetical protein
VPLSEIVIDSSDMHFLVAQELSKHLSDEQRIAIRLYKNDITPDNKDHFPPGYFEQLNCSLRDCAANIAHQSFVVTQLDEALLRFKLGNTAILYRGIGLSQAKRNELEQVGWYWQQKAYSSCTLEEYKADEFARRRVSSTDEGVVLQLEIAAGINILPIAGSSNDLEAEWLLPRNCSFYVESPLHQCDLTKLWRVRIRVESHTS